MKRIGVAGLIRSGGHHSLHLLMGRRGKEPNKGLYVLPGGGLKEGESLEDAFCREIMEETGLEIERRPQRWEGLINVFELPDRLILLAHASVKCKWEKPNQNHNGGYFNDSPRDGDDLYDVKWFGLRDLPWDISPVCIPMLSAWGFSPGKKMKKTEAWWVCNNCGKLLVKPGKKKVKEQMLDHRKVCAKLATFSIKQVSQ